MHENLNPSIEISTLNTQQLCFKLVNLVIFFLNVISTIAKKNFRKYNTYKTTSLTVWCRKSKHVYFTRVKNFTKQFFVKENDCDLTFLNRFSLKKREFLFSIS